MEYTEDQLRAVEKYSHDGPFNDPVVRCDACNKLILTQELKKAGMCSCSNTRVRNLRSIDEQDRDQIQSWINEGKVDSDFLILFEV